MVNRSFDGPNLAAVLLGKRKINLFDLNDPPLSPSQVRVSIDASAICGTQLGEWHQSRGEDLYLPHCFGHEAVGRVIEIGATIREFKVGDRVVISWMKSGYQGAPSPLFHDAVKGERINSGECCTFIRRGIFPENRLVKIEEDVDSPSAAMVGCAFLTAYAALKRSTLNWTRLDQKTVIIGAGGVGFAAVLLAKAFQIPVTCIDVPSVIAGLKLQDIGINFVSTDDAIRGFQNVFSIAIVCTGDPAGFTMAQKLLLNNKGELFIVGNPPYGQNVSIEVKPLLYGRTITGIGEKDVTLPSDILSIISLIKNNRLDATQLVNRTFDISDINRAFEFAAEGNGRRTVVRM